MPILSRLGRLLGVGCPVAHDAPPDKAPFLTGMMDVCAALAHPDHRALLSNVVDTWLDKHPDGLRASLSEALPGGRHGPPIRGQKFYGDHVVELSGVRIDLEKLMIEVLKLNAIGLWEELLGQLHLAEGGASWPPRPEEIAKPTTSVAKMLDGYGQEHGSVRNDPQSLVHWAAMTIHASNGKFFASTLGYATLNALFGRDLEPFVARGADEHGPSAILLSAIADGAWAQTPAADTTELVTRLYERFHLPDRRRSPDTAWGLLDQREGFGHCPAKRLSRVMMTMFAERIASDPDGFIGHIRDTDAATRSDRPKTVYEARAAPQPGQVRAGPLARHQLGD